MPPHPFPTPHEPNHELHHECDRGATPVGAPVDAVLVQRVLGGQVDAFATLVDRHHAHCLRVATHLLGNADDADDVVQESFVRAYRHLGRYSERDRFIAWLLRIVVNQCRSRATREARYTALEPHLHEGLMIEDPNASHADRREELAIALAQLAPEQREAIVLRFGEELSYDEMATVTGAGVSALKMRVQRACARLRTLLSEHLP